MAEATQRSRRRKRQDEPDEAPADTGRSAESEEGAVETARGTADDVTSGVQGTAGDATSGVRDGGGLVSELRGTVRDAALEVLQPIAREAAKSAAKTAATKGPELVKDRLMPKLEEAGGPGALAKGALSKGGDVVGAVSGKFGRKSKAPSGTGRGRRLPVQEHVDVAVDLETAYDQWTQFEEFPRFMHRVEKVEQVDDTSLMWHENIWGVRRSWQASITDQQPCERIAWRSTEGPKQSGVVTFHRLSDRLTRIQVNLDFQPKGLFEKASSGMRISRRALKSDLMRFKAYIEMQDEATGAWRGRIEEGEVVEAPGREEGEEPEAEEREEPEAEEREEPEAEEAEEPEAEEREEPEAEEPEAEEERKEPEEEEEQEEPKAEEERKEPEAEEEQEEPKAEEEEEPEEKPVRRRRVGRTASTGERRTASTGGRSRR